MDPQILVGKPTIKGTRISVALVLEWLSVGWDVPRLLHNYPHLTKEDVRACLAYTAHLLEEERVYLKVKAPVAVSR